MRQNVTLRMHRPPHGRKRPRAASGVDGVTRGTRLGSVALDAPGRPALLEDPAPGLPRAACARVGT
jgi:hypothetical protein